MDAPLLTTPPSAIASGERDGEKRESTSRFETFNPQHLDTPVRITRFENDSRRTDVDARVVNVLLQETAAATDVALALAERVEVLERALQVRGGGVVAPHWGDEDEGEVDGENGQENGDKDVEDELRLQLRVVEAERDQAQRIVRDMKAYLLDEAGSTSQ